MFGDVNDAPAAEGGVDPVYISARIDALRELGTSDAAHQMFMQFAFYDKDPVGNEPIFKSELVLKAMTALKDMEGGARIISSLAGLEYSKSLELKRICEKQGNDVPDVQLHTDEAIAVLLELGADQAAEALQGDIGIYQPHKVVEPLKNLDTSNALSAFAPKEYLFSLAVDFNRGLQPHNFTAMDALVEMHQKVQDGIFKNIDAKEVAYLLDVNAVRMLNPPDLLNALNGGVKYSGGREDMGRWSVDVAADKVSEGMIQTLRDTFKRVDESGITGKAYAPMLEAILARREADLVSSHVLAEQHGRLARSLG